MAVYVCMYCIVRIKKLLEYLLNKLKFCHIDTNLFPKFVLKKKVVNISDENELPEFKEDIFIV